jgi:hypothetical protein
MWGVPCALALALLMTACSSPSTTDQAQGSDAPVASKSSLAPGQVALDPAAATPITIAPVEVRPSAGTVTRMAWTAPDSDAHVAGGFVVVTGRVTTMEDCGTPGPVAVSVIDPAGRVLMKRVFEASALPGSGVRDGILVMAVRDYGVTGSDYASRKDGYLRIDLETGKVLGVTQTDTRAEGQYGSAGADRGLWVGTGPSELGLMDPRTGTMIRTIPTPAPVTGVFATDSALWVVNDQISPLQPYWQLDPADGSVLTSFEWTPQTAEHSAPGEHLTPSAVAVGSGLVLVDNDKVVQRVDADGTVTAVRLEGLADGLPGLPRGSAGQVWIGFESGELVELDAVTLRLRGAGRVAGLQAAADIASDGSTVAVLQGSSDKPQLALLPAAAFSG